MPSLTKENSAQILDQYLKEHGIKKSYLAKKMNMSPSFIKGLIGKFSTDDNDEVIMAPDASYREWQGSTANAHDGGFMDYILEDQMFPQEGIFKGHFGLKDGNGNVLTSVNIILKFWAMIYELARRLSIMWEN